MISKHLLDVSLHNLDSARSLTFHFAIFDKPARRGVGLAPHLYEYCARRVGHSKKEAAHTGRLCRSLRGVFITDRFLRGGERSAGCVTGSPVDQKPTQGFALFIFPLRLLLITHSPSRIFGVHPTVKK